MNQAKATAPARKMSRYVKAKDDGKYLKWKYPDDWFFWSKGEDGIYRKIEAETAYDRLVEWLQNFKVNLETIGFDHSVSDLPEIKDSAIVVDKSMASTQFYAQIKPLKSYKGTIIACDRALPFLIMEDIIPTYVCQLDSSYLCQYFFDLPRVKEKMPEITAVFAVTTHPLTIRLWHGKRVFFTPYMTSLGITKALMERSKTPFMHTGGQVACFAYLLAYNLGAKNIGLFGITHGYDKLEETEYPDVPHKRQKGPYGIVWQDPVYEWYNSIYLDYIHYLLKQGIKTYNCSKSGLLYSEHIEDLSLKEFVTRFG